MLLDSIVLVLVGAAIGYFASASIERKRQAHELKRQIYFDFIDAMAQGRRLFYEEEIRTDLMESGPPDPFPSEEMANWLMSFEAVKLKMEIGASNEIKNFIKNKWPDSRLSRFDAVEEFYQKLIPLIKSDLIMKSWWQFWK